MAIDTESPRTRRALLLAIAGAGAATVATALGRPLPAKAVGGAFDSSNAFTALTAVNTGPNGGLAFTAAAVSGPAIVANSGSSTSTWEEGLDAVYATTTGAGARGVYGVAKGIDGIGVYGRNAPSLSSSPGIGVRGYSQSGPVGVDGESGGAGIGVRGVASSGFQAVVGVHGEASASANGIGVRGLATAGPMGVHGLATHPTSSVVGVQGEANGTGGIGVRGQTSAGTFGVLGIASSPTGVGVRGESAGTAIDGRSTSTIGILGASGAGAGALPDPITAKTGVYGISVGGTGVYGASDTLAGVYGATHSTSRGAVVGQGNDGTGVQGHAGDTSIPTRPSATGVFGTTTVASGAGVRGEALAATGFATGVSGKTISPDGNGVFGYAGATAGYSAGTSGQSVSTAGAGTWGWASGGGSGAMGISGATYPAAAAKTGVFGYADADTASRGVLGKSPAGRGVVGESTSGTAGYFATPKPADGPHSGYALRAIGRVRLDRCAGLATIAAGTKSVVVTPGIDIVSTSAVVATLQGNPGGTTTVQRVALNATANTFTVYLTANSTADVKVAWHVFG